MLRTRRFQSSYRPVGLLPFLIVCLLSSPALAAVYTFPAAQLRGCTDGDTCRFDFHEVHPVIGAVTFRNHMVRLVGLDAPELHPARCDAERELGERARDRLVALLTAAESITIEIVGRRRDKYGRLLGRVLADGRDVAGILIAEGLARPYSGKGKRKGWC